MTVYVASMLGALIGAGAFLGAATFTAMPCQPHAIVGGVAELLSLLWEEDA